MNANLKPLIFTYHALDRMAESHISPSDVCQMIRDSEPEKLTRDMRQHKKTKYGDRDECVRRYRYGSYIFTLADLGTHSRVITVTDQRLTVKRGFT